MSAPALQCRTSTGKGRRGQFRVINLTMFRVDLRAECLRALLVGNASSFRTLPASIDRLRSPSSIAESARRVQRTSSRRWLISAMRPRRLGRESRTVKTEERTRSDSHRTGRPASHQPALFPGFFIVYVTRSSLHRMRRYFSDKSVSAGA